MEQGADLRSHPPPKDQHIRARCGCAPLQRVLQPSRCAAFPFAGCQMRSPVADRILMQCDSQNTSLSPKARKQVEDKREHNAKQDGTGQREIDRCILATVGDISWQAAKRDVGFTEEQNEAAKKKKEQPEADQHAAKIVHAVSV